MALKNPSRILVILLLLSTSLLVYGFGHWYVVFYLTKIAGLALIVGGASLAVCILRIRSLLPKGGSTGRWKKVLLFAVLLILWTAVFVEVNYLGFKFNKRWDTTRAKQHTLTNRTKELIGHIQQDIRLTAFYVGLPPKYLEDLLREYARLSNGRIATEIIDPIVQIGYAAQFGNVISGKEQKIFIQSGKERRELDFTNDVLTEEALTNDIIRVMRKIRRVYFLVGHNEYDLDEEADTGLKVFDAMLLTNNVVSQKLMLGIKGAIPEDCDVLVVAGPKDYLTASEEKIIQDYLQRGGDALFLIENTVITTPDKPLTKDDLMKNPSLNNILNEWGVDVASDVVLDLASHASGDVGSPATRNYLAHKSIVNDLDYTFFVRPRSISIRRERRYTIKVAPIILTASGEGNSWGETNRNLQVHYDPGIDRAGPVPIAFAMWEAAVEGDRSDTRIIVITDADFLSNAFVEQYSNARLGINAINWLSEVDYEVLTEKKDIKVQRLDLTSRQKRVVGVVLVLMPLLIALAGTVVWIRHRIV